MKDEGTSIPAIRIRLGLEEYEAKDNLHNAIYLLLDWTTIGVAIAISTIVADVAPVPLVLIVYLCAIAIIGSRQRALMNLVHHASHRQLFKKRLANDRLGQLLAAWPLLVSLKAYREDHMTHHRDLGVWERDPKTQRYAMIGLISAPTSAAQFVFRHVIEPMLLVYAPFNLRGALLAKGERRGRAGLWLVVVTIVVMAGWSTEFVEFWLVPMATTFQILRHWAETAEHASLVTEADEWMRTRSWTSWWFVRWFLAPHSDHYHLLHHQFPSVAHYWYATVHALLMKECPEYAAGHHCDGFFLPHRSDAPSVLQDIVDPAGRPRPFLKRGQPWFGLST